MGKGRDGKEERWEMGRGLPLKGDMH